MAKVTDDSDNTNLELQNNDELRDELLTEFMDLFFSRESITHTLQCMLLSIGYTLDDLCQLAITIHNNDIVFAMCNSGIMPCANNFAYVIPFAYMTKRQLQFVKRSTKPRHTNCASLHVEYVDGFLYTCQLRALTRVDDANLLFGLCNIMNKALLCDRNVKEQYINSCLFKVINSCTMRPGAVRDASRWFDENGGVGY